MKKPKEKATPSLGDEVKENITGATGIVVAKVYWINGCVRCVVQSKADKDGKVPDAQTFDEPNLSVTRAGAVPRFDFEVIEGDAPTGGPIPTPTQTPKIKL